jgi:hypothetical protein
MRMYEWNNIDLVFAGLGGGVWTTDDIHIGVYSIFRSFMVCAWIENGLWAERCILMIGVGAGLQGLW